MLKGKFAEPSRSIEILWSSQSETVHFVFMLLTGLIIKKSHNFAGIYALFFSEQDIINKSWYILNTKSASQGIDWKYSYQERNILAFFCKLVALILVQNYAKCLRVMKLVKKVKSGSSWKQVTVLRDNYPQYIWDELKFLYEIVHPRKNLISFFRKIFVSSGKTFFWKKWLSSGD